MKRSQLSEPMKRVLVNLLHGESATAHLVGMSEHGGHTKVMAALHRRNLVDRGGRLTSEGIAVAKALEKQRSEP
jgi:hypothetical protein